MIISLTEIRGFDAALSLAWLVDCVFMRMCAASAVVAGWRAFCMARLPGDYTSDVEFEVIGLRCVLSSCFGIVWVSAKSQ